MCHTDSSFFVFEVHFPKVFFNYNVAFNHHFNAKKNIEIMSD